MGRSSKPRQEPGEGEALANGNDDLSLNEALFGVAAALPVHQWAGLAFPAGLRTYGLWATCKQKK